MWNKHAITEEGGKGNVRLVNSAQNQHNSNLYELVTRLKYSTDHGNVNPLNYCTNSPFHHRNTNSTTDLTIYNLDTKLPNHIVAERVR